MSTSDKILQELDELKEQYETLKKQKRQELLKQKRKEQKQRDEMLLKSFRKIFKNVDFDSLESWENYLQNLQVSVSEYNKLKNSNLVSQNVSNLDSVK